jgi:protein-tyrosine sulfotransferase
MDPNRGAEFIFVGGAARSGTTVLQNILDTHPDIVGAPEFHHLVDVGKLRTKMHALIENGLIDQICSPEDVDRSLCQLIEGLLRPLREKCGCRYLSEKTPDNVLVFPELIGLFPGARFIWVVRDPRAVIASMLQVGRRARKVHLPTQDFTQSLLAAIAYIRQCFKAGAAAQQLAPERVITVSYERLVSSPEAETKRICRFLAIDWTEQMLHPASMKHFGEKAITIKNVWYDSASYNRNPETKEIDKWKYELSLIQQAIVATAFRNVADFAQFGYDLSMDGLAGQSLSAAARVGQKAKRRLKSVQRLIADWIGTVTHSIWWSACASIPSSEVMIL